MRLGGQRASHNVEDRRGMGMAAGGLGVGGIVIAVIAYFLGFDPGMVTSMVEGTGAPQQQVEKGTPSDDAGQFVAKVLGSTEDVWGEIFRRSGVWIFGLFHSSDQTAAFWQPLAEQVRSMPPTLMEAHHR